MMPRFSKTGSLTAESITMLSRVFGVGCESDNRKVFGQCTRLDRIINCFVKSNSYFRLLMPILIFF